MKGPETQKAYLRLISTLKLGLLQHYTIQDKYMQTKLSFFNPALLLEETSIKDVHWLWYRKHIKGVFMCGNTSLTFFQLRLWGRFWLSLFETWVCLWDTGGGRGREEEDRQRCGPQQQRGVSLMAGGGSKSKDLLFDVKLSNSHRHTSDSAVGGRWYCDFTAKIYYTGCCFQM